MASGAAKRPSPAWPKDLSRALSLNSPRMRGWMPWARIHWSRPRRSAVSWEGSSQSSGDPAAPEGRTVEGSRLLQGDGLVATDAGAAFELKGEVGESIYQVEAEGYRRFTWQSLVDATVTGSDAFGDGAGWRADLYLSAGGGDGEGAGGATLELRGNAYFFEPRIAGRFDSIDVELSFGADLDCTAEPHGWISLRDEDAFWYDLVFLPLEDGEGTATDPAACDGCGTLYIRGLETVAYGEVCPDLDGAWQVDPAEPPDAEGFLLGLRDLLTLEGA